MLLGLGRQLAGLAMQNRVLLAASLLALPTWTWLYDLMT